MATAGIAGLSGVTFSCSNRSTSDMEEEGSGEEEEMVSANEDLMREHGLLQRMMLIYDAAVLKWSDGREFNPALVRSTAEIIHNFIEDYHEKLEEDHVFPRLEEADVHRDLTDILRKQHRAGRQVTEKVLALTSGDPSQESLELSHLIRLMRSFNLMYRPHESREETVLFPAFKEVLTEKKYASLGEEFEEIEHQKFGGDGFDMMVDRVEEIERQAGIYELDQFTPVTPP